MKPDKHHEKVDIPCPACGSTDTYHILTVPEGYPDVDDLMLYCDSCKGEFT